MVHLPTFSQEIASLSSGEGWVIGCDEVGRGCLAGPVVAAAVLFRWDGEAFSRREPLLRHVRDSKMLSAKQRASALELIHVEAASSAVGIVDSAQIDAVNIHNASLLAMRKAIDGLKRIWLEGAEPVVLIDGRFGIPSLPFHQRAIVDGDADVFSIAAASIIAKEYRDQFMHELHHELPAYGFDRHVGYATKQHHEAILEQGLTAHHRRSFCGKYLLAQSQASP